jgi:hypothetical protein
MITLHFTSIIKLNGINPYVLVSKSKAIELKPDWKKPMPVCVRINGLPKKAWHINMMPVGNGSFYLYLHGEARKVSETKVGDKVNVEVWFDETYKSGPAHPMPPELKAALDKHAKARKGWEELIPSRQKEILRYLASLKSSEAKARNIEKALHVLSGKGGRFMARDWEKK